MRWIHKIVISGTSAQINIPRELLFRMKARPGEFVELTHDDDANVFSVRLWATKENGTHRGPGKIVEDPVVTR